MSSFKRPKIIPPARFYQNYAHVELSPSNKISVCGDQMQIVNWNFLHKKKVLTIDGATKNCRQWVQKLLTENQKNWRKISRRSTKKQKSTEEVSDAWMGMLIEAPLYVAPLPIWQSWNCGGPVHLDIKSKHADDSRTLRSLSRTTYHMYQSYTPIMNCMELCCWSTPSSRCENLHESPVKGWISHGTPLLSETGQFTRFSTTCWISHIFAILPLFYPPRPWHLLACRFHTTCDKSFSDFTQILFRSIFQLCNNRLPTKVWLVLSWPTSI